MDNKKNIYLLQSNLKPIRQIAGWTAEQLGEKIGVSKQTISNLENMRTPMSLTQYIAIRTILDYEIETNKENIVLPQVISILLDRNEELTDEENKKLNDAIKAVAASAAGGVTGATLATIFSGIVASALGAATLTGTAISLGPIGLIAGGAVVGTAHWLKKILGKK